MFATRATDRNREVAARVLGIARQPFANECLNVIGHLTYIIKPSEPVGDRLIFAGEGAATPDRSVGWAGTAHRTPCRHR